MSTSVERGKKHHYTSILTEIMLTEEHIGWRRDDEKSPKAWKREKKKEREGCVQSKGRNKPDLTWYPPRMCRPWFGIIHAKAFSPRLSAI